MYVIKRDGSEQVFDASKIKVAITKANNSVKEDARIKESTINAIVNSVVKKCEELNRAVGIEEIQDLVEDELVDHRAKAIAKAYITYRYERARSRNTTDDVILSLVDQRNEEANQENSNKNPVLNSTQRDYIAGYVSKDIARRYIFAPDIVNAHDNGWIHISDMDYAIGKTHNCCLVNLEDMLQNGTVISGTKIDKPHKFTTACNIATQIVAQIASGQYGGTTITLSHLAPFVEESRKQFRKFIIDEFNKLNIAATEEQISTWVEDRVKKEISDGVQILQYQVNTLLTCNGQTPFLSVAMFLCEAKNEREKKDLAMIMEEVLKQRIQGVKNEKGVYITNAFPKLLYLLEEDNCKEDRPYWYLTELAAKCSAKRMVPDYISEKIMLRDKIDKNGEGHAYPCMGCRSFLTPYVNKDGKPQYYGRCNLGVVTLNLPNAALAANGNVDEFWKILDARAELCHRALQTRWKRIADAPSDISPIHWQHGGLCRLKPGEKIGKVIFGGYCTVSLGYAGLWETVRCLTGKKLIEKEGHDLGIAIMKRLNSYTAKWKADENLDYSIYGSPIENMTYKFARCNQKDYPIIPDVNDKNYVTNSFHIKVTEPCDAFFKLGFESEFQRLSPGGVVDYVESPNLEDNIPAVLEVVKFIYDNIMYAEINTKSDYCQKCGYDGEIQIVEDSGKLYWECPNCGNRDHATMNIARRVCGYISTNDMNQGRMQDVKERCLHL